MEREKLLIEIIKIKLLFFSAVVGGSFGYLVSNNSFLIDFVLIITLLVGVIGVVKSLYELGTLYNVLKDKK